MNLVEDKLLGWGMMEAVTYTKVVDNFIKIVRVRDTIKGQM